MREIEQFYKQELRNFVIAEDIRMMREIEQFYRQEHCSTRSSSPKVEQSHVADSGGSDYRSATPDADSVWFRADMDSDEFRDPLDIGSKAKDTAPQEEHYRS